MNALNDEMTAKAVPEKTTRRRGLRGLLMVLLPLALLGTGSYVWLTGGRFETTENANLQLPKLSISAEVGGRVTEVLVDDGDRVSAGDVLFRIDPESYRIALAHAEASLASAELSVRQLKAEYASALAKDMAAADDVAYYRKQFERQQSLKENGVVPASTFDAAERALHVSEEAKISADQAVARALAALGGDPDAPVETHPAVLTAAAARDQAAYNLERATVTAPSEGIVARSAAFRPGQFVQPGAALFALVETSETWVEANFKETQLANMGVGQSATVSFDSLPGRQFAAHVASIGAGTGSEFSLLPAQNATGNWVKVTQRVPVRLALDEAPDNLVVSGMSATVEVDTGVSRHIPGLSALAAE